jgi:hypothetical protein
LGDLGDFGDGRCQIWLAVVFAAWCRRLCSVQPSNLSEPFFSTVSAPHGTVSCQEAGHQLLRQCQGDTRPHKTKSLRAIRDRKVASLLPPAGPLLTSPRDKLYDTSSATRPSLSEHGRRRSCSCARCMRTRDIPRSGIVASKVERGGASLATLGWLGYVSSYTKRSGLLIGFSVSLPDECIRWKSARREESELVTRRFADLRTGVSEASCKYRSIWAGVLGKAALPGERGEGLCPLIRSSSCLPVHSTLSIRHVCLVTIFFFSPGVRGSRLHACSSSTSPSVDKLHTISPSAKGAPARPPAITLVIGTRSLILPSCLSYSPR